MDLIIRTHLIVSRTLIQRKKKFALTNTFKETNKTLLALNNNEKKDARLRLCVCLLQIT